MKYLRQMRYVICHKWFVFLECWKMGIPWLGIVHDWSKFWPSEFIPYARYFGGEITKGRDETGYYKPCDTGDLNFERAFFYHTRRNKHHWQSWVLATGSASVKALPIPEKYLREMLADWHGAGKAQGISNAKAWYEAHKDDLVLHLRSRRWLEDKLGISILTTEEQRIIEERLESLGHL